MTPHAGIGDIEVPIIDLEHGVVVPELDVRYADPDLWYEVAMFTETTFVEFRDLAHGYVQAAQESSVQEQLYDFFPGFDLLHVSGIVAVVSAKKDVPDDTGRGL